MKKIRVLILTAIAMLALCVTANAAKIGDVVGEAVYSDIGAYINHFPIKSYAIDGQTVMVAEDLRAYGCDVVWDNSTRSLYITTSANDIIGTTVFKPSQPTGTHFADLLYTDIAVYINGRKIPSYAINGYTMITIEDFGAAMSGFTWVQDIRAAKAWIDGKNMTSYKPINPRTICVYDGVDYEGKNNLSGYFDFNNDGTEEFYSLNTLNDGNQIKTTIGNYTNTSEMYWGVIGAAYICNLDSGDNWSLAVITNEESGDPRFRIYTYTNNGLKLEKFKYYYEEDYTQYAEIKDHLWIGYVHKHYFNVDADGVITVREQTASDGMWNIYTTYQFNGSEYEFIDTSYYEIIPDFMFEREFYYDDMSAYEKQMWYSGWIKAYTNFRYSGFSIKKGEYFRVTHDDGHNFIFIQKADGNMAWVKLDYSDMYDLNPHFFYMAG